MKGLLTPEGIKETLDKYQIKCHAASCSATDKAGAIRPMPVLKAI